MGTATCAGTVVSFDDTVLTHLQIVIIQKFRRGQSFALSWMSADAGPARESMWLNPASPVVFHFDEPRVPAVDQDWLGLLARSADSATGLIVTDAAGALVPATRGRSGAAPN